MDGWMDGRAAGWINRSSQGDKRTYLIRDITPSVDEGRWTGQYRFRIENNRSGNTLFFNWIKMRNRIFSDRTPWLSQRIKVNVDTHLLDVKCIARLAFKKSQVGVILGEIYIHTCRQNTVYTSVFCMSNHKKKRMTSPSLLAIHVVTWKNQEQPNVLQKTRRQGCCRVHNSEWNMSTWITMIRWFYQCLSQRWCKST